MSIAADLRKYSNEALLRCAAFRLANTTGCSDSGADLYYFNDGSVLEVGEGYKEAYFEINFR